MTRASGQFQVSFEPLSADDEIISRMQMVKTFTGSLDGHGVLGIGGTFRIENLGHHTYEFDYVIDKV
jgi:hypothetical protein